MRMNQSPVSTRRIAFVFGGSTARAAISKLLANAPLKIGGDVRFRAPETLAPVWLSA